MNKCQYCGLPINNDKFCNRSCASSYNNKQRVVSKETKIKISNSLKREPKTYNCKNCNSLIKSRRHKLCDDCKGWNQNVVMFKKIGLFINGKNLSIINKNVLKFLVDLYFNKQYSSIMIKDEFGIRENTLFFYFRKNGISLRTNSDANSLAFLMNRNNPTSSYNYKHGWHTTWDGKNVYYRSSYELEYCQKLDESKIPYDMEFKRFAYYDTQKKSYRVAIPDFYLPLENKIVEIKSTYNYDEINMNDRFVAYQDNGYNTEYIIWDIKT